MNLLRWGRSCELVRNRDFIFFKVRVLRNLYSWMNERAVSEIVASLILILIAASIGTTLYAYSLTLFSSTRSNMENTIMDTELREKEQFTVTHVLYDSFHDKLYIYIYNYGEVEMTVSTVYINTQIANQTKVLIPAGNISCYTISNVEASGLLTGGIERLVVVSERGNRYETTFQT